MTSPLPASFGKTLASSGLRIPSWPEKIPDARNQNIGASFRALIHSHVQTMVNLRTKECPDVDVFWEIAPDPGLPLLPTAKSSERVTHSVDERSREARLRRACAELSHQTIEQRHSAGIAVRAVSSPSGHPLTMQTAGFQYGCRQ